MSRSCTQPSQSAWCAARSPRCGRAAPPRASTMRRRRDRPPGRGTRRCSRRTPRTSSRVPCRAGVNHRRRRCLRVETGEEARRFAAQPRTDRERPELVRGGEVGDDVLRGPPVAAAGRAPLLVGQVGERGLETGALAPQRRGDRGRVAVESDDGRAVVTRGDLHGAILAERGRPVPLLRLEVVRRGAVHRTARHRERQRVHVAGEAGRPGAAGLQPDATTDRLAGDLPGDRPDPGVRVGREQLGERARARLGAGLADARRRRSRCRSATIPTAR